MVLGAGLERCEKISPRLGFDSRTVQLVASRYTDYAVPVHSTGRYVIEKHYANLLLVKIEQKWRTVLSRLIS